MKTSFKKLQKFAALRHDRRPPKHHQPLAVDELARATQDMNDMRDCYDGLLSAAAATANSVYEFSESLKEMGDCLLEKTALNDDEESGKVLLKLGKVQFELQKLVDAYRSHIFQTITVPSESLLNELRIVEEMKKRCDVKREIYEDMIKKQKGRLRGSKGESFHLHQLQTAHDEYDEEGNVFVCRMKSLKQGQSRSLLTQASRHHAAQLSFFRKAVKSLESIEPHVRLVAEQQHIAYQFNELKDDELESYDDDETDSDEDDDTDDGSEAHDDGELSFEHGQKDPVQEASTLKHPMEEHFPSPRRNSFSFRRDIRLISKSAPLFPDQKLDSANRLSQMRSSPSRKFISYVLPRPDETKGPFSGKLNIGAPQVRQEASNPWHSSPLRPNKYEKHRENEKLSGPIILDTQSVLKESNNNTKASRLPPSLSEGLSSRQFDHNFPSDAKKVKRQSFSGPITGKTWPNNPNFTASGPIPSSGYLPYSGSLLRAPLPQQSPTPRLSSGFSPIFTSSPKISELHELPRPPTHSAVRKQSNRGTHSGPLLAQRHEMTSTARVSTTTPAAAVLPRPPLVLPRSYSIPAGGPVEVEVHVPLESSRNAKITDDMSSPASTPAP